MLYSIIRFMCCGVFGWMVSEVSPDTTTSITLIALYFIYGITNWLQASNEGD